MPKMLIVIGLIIVMIGLLWSIFPNIFSWFGKLPGDISYESGNTRIYFPVVTMIIVSLVLSFLINLFNR